MQRYYASQDGHVVPLINPKDITGGATSPAFALKLYSHASILVQIGVSAAAFTKIILNACTDAAGDGATAIPFNLYTCETTATDVLSTLVPVTSAGYTPSANDNIFYVIEIDASALPAGSAYLQLSLTNTTNSVIASAVAFLSGARFASDQSPTVLA